MLLRGTPTQFSVYRYMYVFSPLLREWIYVGHPQNYSKDSAKLARFMFNTISAPDEYDANGERIEGYNPFSHGRNKAKCHVIIGHTHQQQEAWSEDGNYRCIALGCMRDPRKTHYQRHASNKYPEWNSGFGVWMDGEYLSVSKYGTNWEALLGPELYAMLE